MLTVRNGWAAAAKALRQLKEALEEAADCDAYCQRRDVDGLMRLQRLAGAHRVVERQRDALLEYLEDLAAAGLAARSSPLGVTLEGARRAACEANDAILTLLLYLHDAQRAELEILRAQFDQGDQEGRHG